MRARHSTRLPRDPGKSERSTKCPRLFRSRNDGASGVRRETVSQNSVFLTASTGSALGKLQFHVFAALVEFERNLIRERILAGLTAARARGRVGGRKLKLNDKQIWEIRALLADPAA